MRIKKIIIRVVECGHGRYRAYRFDSELPVFESNTQESAIAACVAANAAMFEEYIATAMSPTGTWSASIVTDDESGDRKYALGVTRKRAIEALCASCWEEFATPLFPAAIYG